MKYNCDTWLQSYMAETVVRNTVKELYFARACWLNNFNNNSNFNANNRNVNNNNGLRGIAQQTETRIQKK